MKLTVNLTKFSTPIGFTPASPTQFGYYASRVAIVRAISNGFSRAFGVNGGNYLVPNWVGDGTIRVYTLEKRRKVVKVVVPKKGPIDRKNRQVVRPAHWVGRVYDIPTSLLKALGLRVVQMPRTFHFVKAQ